MAHIHVVKLILKSLTLCACFTFITIFCMDQQEELNKSLYEFIKNYKENSLDYIQELLKKGAQPDWLDSKSGDTALHNAVYLRRSDVLKELLKHVKNCNVPASDGQTPLHRAMIIHMPAAMMALQQSINNNDIQPNVFARKTNEIVSILLLQGADPCFKDLKEHTPINIADNNKNEEAKALCTNSLIYIQNISNAITHNDVKLFEECLTKPEAPINSIHKETGNTFLHDAILHELIAHTSEEHIRPFFIKKLIGMGLNINHRNKLGQTPFFIACQQKKKLMVIYLLFWCPQLDISVTDNTGGSALGFWIANGWYNMLNKLIIAGYELKKEKKLDDL